MPLIVFNVYWQTARREYRRWYWLALALVLVLQGCAPVTPRATMLGTIEARDLDRILSGEVLLNSAPAHQLDSALESPNTSARVHHVEPKAEQVLALNDDMRWFVDTYVSDSSSSERRLQSLLRAIFHGGMLGLEYDPLKTYNAADTFRYQEGNCLSFTNMFVALGREAGLKVWFNEVKVPPTWDMHSASTHVYYRHMNAVVKTHRGTHIVDLNLENYDVDYPQHRVSDEYAIAQFYNNRAMELLFEGDIVQAFHLIRAALQLEPELAFLWGNLGTIYRRGHWYDEAEIAYRQVLSLEPSNLMAMSNLGRLYRQMAASDNDGYYLQQADYFDQLASRYRLKNPYYHYHLAQQALDQRAFDVALTHIEAAIDGYREDHRFYFLAAKIHGALGQARHAQAHLHKAAKWTRDETQKRRYHNKLAAIDAR